MTKSLFSSLLFIVALGLASVAAAQNSPGPTSDGGNSVVNYAISPGDLVQVKVFQEPDLESLLRVTTQGDLTFPLIGVVHVGGQSPHSAANAIKAALEKDYLVNAQVTVTVIEYTKRRFTVLGQVQKPGAYDMPDRDAMTVLQAIGMAGGYTRVADPGRIVLKRLQDGKEAIFKLNGKKMAGAGASSDFPIRPGDIITVQESIF